MTAAARRVFLRGAAAAGALGLTGAAGCSATRSTSAPSSPPSPSSPASGTASSTPSVPGPPSASAPPSASGPALPAAAPWTPGPGELQPDVKLRAVQLVEALGSWPAGTGGAAQAGAAVSALGLDPALAGQAGPLRPPAEAAVLRVRYAQYGGLLADSASVLVICEQTTMTAGSPTTVSSGGTTVDVRLSRARPRWTVTELHPGQPGPPAAQLTDAARRVLTAGGIELPPGARADIASGAVHDSVLDAMLALARTYAFTVSVVRSGHPIDVFGTDRPSDHPLGRAFDVWRIEGHPVVDPATPTDLVDGFMRAAARAGSYNVGGPRQLSGGATANQFFSDDTHHDHVHVGFQA
ncbi:hypothetical protein CFP65_0113 [Kitasatospora sp. MMS16-BH015]|uniref:hypothetical protein n=1 Tax=Kitasatospora sp. MMS16-BH015 TaxID=2018025 RepID=UPI000CA17FF4|nr:hypothetical protein [Kitasatospora sp. MMS16-BH015]AUG75097.1 hypothetical protein CFP65_0113 [Kitasatospora sp. MMS16-BH015]